MSKLLTPFNMTLLFAVIGLVFTFTSYSEAALSILGVFAMALVVLFVHELGHIIGGRLAGYRFLYMTVGPITIEKDPNLKITPNQNWMAFGGIAGCVPAETDITDLVKRHKLFAAGGPVLTAIAFLISLLVWSITNAETAMMFAIFNIAIFLATAIPFQGSFKSDGSVFLLLQKGGKEAETFLAGLILLKEMMSTKSPLDWNEQLIREAQNAEASAETVTTAFILFYYHLVKSGYETASRLIAPFKRLPVTKKTKINLQFVTHIRQIDALFSAKPDVEFIQTMHSQMTKLEPVSYKRSEAIIAYLQGDTVHANKLLDEVLEKCAKGAEQYGFFVAERQLTLSVINQLEKHAPEAFF